MTPLSLIKYTAEHFQGTPYEPWINTLLIVLFTTAVCSAIFILLGKDGRSFLSNAASAIHKKIRGRRGYSPEVENFRLRIEPYIELLAHLYFAFIGIYSAALVGVTAILAINKAPLWALFVGLLWVSVSFFYMRINLESASWAYHKIKSRHIKVDNRTDVPTDANSG